MALPIANNPFYTYAEYLEFEEGQEIRHEYFKGGSRVVLGKEQHLHLAFFNLTIPVAAIYEDVNLEK